MRISRLFASWQSAFRQKFQKPELGPCPECSPMPAADGSSITPTLPGQSSSPFIPHRCLALNIAPFGKRQQHVSVLAIPTSVVHRSRPSKATRTGFSDFFDGNHDSVLRWSVQWGWRRVCALLVRALLPEGIVRRCPF